MLTVFKTLDELKAQAVRCYNGMVIVYPNGIEKETDEVSGVAKRYNGFYSRAENIVAFCYGGDFYVIPRTGEVDKCLIKYLRERYFPVPFIGEEYPKDEQKWFALLEWARRTKEKEFSKMCESYNKENKISELDVEFMRNSMEIPVKGMWVLHNNNTKSCYYPIVQKRNVDSYYYLGKFNEEGRVFLFVKDGKTYLAKYSKKGLNLLYHAGYKPSNLEVPLSTSGDQLIDPILKAKWKAIKPID